MLKPPSGTFNGYKFYRCLWKKHHSSPLCRSCYTYISGVKGRKSFSSSFCINYLGSLQANRWSYCLTSTLWPISDVWTDNVRAWCQLWWLLWVMKVKIELFHLQQEISFTGVKSWQRLIKSLFFAGEPAFSPPMTETTTEILNKLLSHAVCV